jgi:hypothetical protein
MTGRTIAGIGGAVASVLAMLLLASVGSAQRAQPKDPEDAPELYPAHPNRDDAFYACTACHSFKIVAQQGMSRARWNESLDWMTERHQMPKLDGKDREKVLDYLATIYPERTQPSGWKNPFATQ